MFIDVLSKLYGVSAASVQPLQNVLNAAARIILRKRKFDHITTDVRDRLHSLLVQQRIEYKVCVLVYKCLNQPIVVTSVKLHVHDPDQRDRAKDVLLFLVQHPSGTHFRCLFVIHH